MKATKNYVPFFITASIIIWVFLNWLTSPVVLGGDFNFVNYDQFKIYAQKPYIWDYNLNNGFGQITLFTLPFFYYTFLAYPLTFINSNPFLLHKLIYFIPLLLITTLSTYFLSQLITRNKWAQACAILLYATNPYFIMLASGGQLGVALAYGFSPAVFAIYLATLHRINKDIPSIIKIKWYLWCAFATAILVAFDSRLALIMLGTITFLYLGNWVYSKIKKDLFLDYIALAGIVMIVVSGFHAYWILPSLFVQSVSLPHGYATTQAVQFFSFGRFAHTLTWTHPNYPQNIFGVVKEVSGFAFIFPVLAFFMVRSNRKIILYFALLALGAAFLAKGTNDPGGNIYLYAFNHIPLFSWFRDSTKFFLPLSIAYSMLIALTIQELLQSNLNNLKKTMLLIGCCALIFISWRPTLTHSVSGTLAYKKYPQQFKDIEQVLKKDKTFGRVLWVPTREMYGYADANHPAVSLQELRNYPYCLPTLCVPESSQPDSNKKAFTKDDLFKQIDAETSLFADPFTEEIFQSLGINYVIVSPDVEKSMYIYDRKYDQAVKEYYVEKISHIPWLKNLNINNLTAFSTQNKGSLFMWGSGLSAETAQFRMINPTRYSIKIAKANSQLLFSQSYDENWLLRQGKATIYPMKTKTGFMEIPTGDLKQSDAIVEFTGQQFAYIGWTTSVITILFAAAFIIMIEIKGRKPV